MFTKSGGLQGFSGLYTSAQSNVVEPKGVLKKVVVDEKLEDGPPNQDELREAMKLAYNAAIKRSQVIDQIGGQLIKEDKPAKPKSVVKKKTQKKVGSSKKQQNSLPTRW